VGAFSYCCDYNSCSLKCGNSISSSVFQYSDSLVSLVQMSLYRSLNVFWPTFVANASTRLKLPLKRLHVHAYHVDSLMAFVVDLLYTKSAARIYNSSRTNPKQIKQLESDLTVVLVTSIHPQLNEIFSFPVAQAQARRF